MAVAVADIACRLTSQNMGGAVSVSDQLRAFLSDKERGKGRPEEPLITTDR